VTQTEKEIIFSQILARIYEKQGRKRTAKLNFRSCKPIRLMEL
jgi:hypothetical protein